MHIALPGWLAFSGVPAMQIATFLGIITLPWAFKLLIGPVVDHFEFLPMGKRRPWVLGAQLGMVGSFLALAVIEDPLSQFGLLTAICFMVNVFTATQDVAVDGMSIDLVPLEEEGRLNAFMSFGKSAGWAATAALPGVCWSCMASRSPARYAPRVHFFCLYCWRSCVSARVSGSCPGPEVRLRRKIHGPRLSVRYFPILITFSGPGPA
jgi:MFS family permease